jgi:hypothetical protein
MIHETEEFARPVIAPPIPLPFNQFILICFH